MGNAPSSGIAPMDKAAEGLPLKYRDGAPVASLSSVARATCLFRNNSGHNLDMLWMNFLGQPHSYGVLKAGANEIMHTYVTHPWIFRVAGNPEATASLVLAGSRKQVLFPSAACKEYTIELAGDVRWSPATHPKFSGHEMFKAQVRAMLTAHHHLHKQGAAAFTLRPEEAVRRASSFVYNCLPLGATSMNLGRSFSDGDMGSARLCEAQAAGKGLCTLPHDLVLEILRHMAPSVPDVEPSEQADMQGPPADLQQQHQETMQHIQAQLQAYQQQQLLLQQQEQQQQHQGQQQLLAEQLPLMQDGAELDNMWPAPAEEEEEEEGPPLMPQYQVNAPQGAAMAQWEQGPALMAQAIEVEDEWLDEEEWHEALEE